MAVDWRRALGVAAIAGVGGMLLKALGVPVSFLLWTAGLAALVIVAFPRLIIALLEELHARLRAWYWAPHEGRHHMHRGLSMHVEDDGMFVWIAGADLQVQLGTKDRDDVLAARHAGHCRRDGEGRLMLRADAVLRHLATMPGRDEPRLIRLRRYIERDIVYPAEQRRRRAASLP